jgi:hypothetical protein
LIITSMGSILVSLVCVFFVVSKKRFLHIFAIKGRSHNSDILKNAIMRKGIIVPTAKTVAIVLFHQVLMIPFQTNKAAHAHIATITNWIREIDRGPIWKFILNHHFSIFLG